MSPAEQLRRAQSNVVRATTAKALICLDYHVVKGGFGPCVYCTRPEGHADDHEARDLDNVLVAKWRRSP